MKRGQAIDKLLEHLAIPFDVYAYRMSPFLLQVFAYQHNQETNFYGSFIEHMLQWTAVSSGCFVSLI